MKLRKCLILAAALVLASAAVSAAQEPGDSAQTLENLRAQLNETQDREAELKIRLDQLNFDLKPENIERHFNGFGSTRPEELREHRRRQLQLEKDRVVDLLSQLESQRARLEADISTAQMRQFQPIARGAIILKPDQDRRNRLWNVAVVLVEGLVLALVIGSLVWRIVIRRRRNI